MPNVVKAKPIVVKDNNMDIEKPKRPLKKIKSKSIIPSNIDSPTPSPVLDTVKSVEEKSEENSTNSGSVSPTQSPLTLKKKPSFSNPLDTISMNFHDTFLIFLIEIDRPKSSTSTFWKGGLVVDGQFICNILALTKSEQPNQLFQR